VAFERLVSDPSNRGTVISTFLAVLELCKRQVVQVRQSEVFDEIVVELRSGDVDAAKLTSEYDITAARAELGGHKVMANA
jgi:chromatin segregation and condensation protein Rec8/ScpA/Scc1 (kleisin family)